MSVRIIMLVFPKKNTHSEYLEINEKCLIKRNDIETKLKLIASKIDYSFKKCSMYLITDHINSNHSEDLIEDTGDIKKLISFIIFEKMNFFEKIALIVDSGASDVDWYEFSKKSLSEFLSQIDFNFPDNQFIIIENPTYSDVAAT